MKQLHAALLAAFPTRARLAQLVRFGLEKNLDAISEGKNLDDTVFDLLEWADAQGCIAALLAAATELNPGNPELRAHVEAAPPARAQPRVPSASELRAYLTWFKGEMGHQNHGDPTFVRPRAGLVPQGPSPRLDYAPSEDRAQVVKRVRQVVRLLSGTSEGGDHASAQLASLNRQSRLVDDVVKTLMASPFPMVILGDPGSGKSMVLRRVGEDLAQQELRRREPGLAVVYVRVGQYRSTSPDGSPGPVIDLVRQNIPVEHGAVREGLESLVQAGRVVLLFDGMDEMDRALYNERVRALSTFARRSSGLVKTLFTCRINDFSPEFEHRQMVLLSFDRHQIFDYVRDNLKQALIDGKPRRPREIVRLLMDDAHLGASTQNPLLLFLTCLFIRLEGKLPTSRREIFETFVNSLFTRLADTCRSKGTVVPDRKNLAAAWARIAFEITRRTGGTYLEQAALARVVGPEHGETAIAAGLGCGLLSLDRGAGDAVRFSHHRLQEYFTAVHVQHSEGELDWPSLMDVPRWQETLIYIASLNPSHESLVSLTRCLAPAVVPDALSDPDEERRLADRAVLASHVLREVGAEGIRACEDLREELVGTLFVLSTGRPTSQIKVLWACTNLVNQEVGPLIDPLRESNVDWVREQALFFIANVDSTRRGIGANVGQELLLDLVGGKFPQRFPAYFRALTRKGWSPWLGALALALGCWLAYISAIGAIFLFAWRLTNGLVRLNTASQLLEAPLWIASAAIGVAVSSSFLATRFQMPWWRAAAMTTSAVLCGSAAVAFQLSGTSTFLVTFFGINFWLMVSILLSISGSLAYALHAAVFAALIVPLSRQKVRPKDVITVAVNRAMPRVELEGVLLLAAMASLGVLSHYWTWLNEGTWLAKALKLNTLIVCIATVGLSSMVFVFARRRSGSTTKALKEAGLTSFISGSLGGLLLFMIWALSVERIALMVVILMFGAALFGVGYSSWRQLRSVANQIAYRVRPSPATLSELSARIEAGSAEERAYLFGRVQPRQFGAKPGDILIALRHLEPRITGEPASSAYWRLIHELESIARQDQVLADKPSD